MGKRREKPFALKLHLELDISNLDEEEFNILQKYGRVKEGIIREVIVPGDMNLHALHYVINRLFGWQNSHLHSFSPREECFAIMTNEKRYREWSLLAGLYFRYPSDDFSNIYWDDDYSEGQSFKTWLRRKYKGPYRYGGSLEYYDVCQRDIKDFEERFKILDVRKSFSKLIEERSLLSNLTDEDWNKLDTIEKSIPIQEASLDDIENTIDMGGRFDEILERLKICDVLLLTNSECQWSEWKNWKCGILDGLNAMVLGYGIEPRTRPCLNTIIYNYDYGDNWLINIICTDIWNTKEEFEETAYDVEPLMNHRPICVSVDGMNLFDDVGGISGFCRFLREINEGEIEERRSLKCWASSLGWTGRQVKAENIL